MSMIRGKIESDREIAPREITYGESPFTQQGNKWVITDEPDKVVVITSLGELLKEAGYDTTTSDIPLKKSADACR